MYRLDSIKCCIVICVTDVELQNESSELILLILLLYHAAEARAELNAYLHSLKEQLANIEKLKTVTKEEKVNIVKTVFL